MQILVKAGPHRRGACPVSLPVRAPAGADTEHVTLTDLHTACVIPGQCEVRNGQTVLHWVVDHLDAGGERLYSVQFGGEAAHLPGDSGVQITAASNDRIDIVVAGRLFTSYRCGNQIARPYWYPLNDTLGSCVTRANVGEKPGETTDHVHHRSLWTAYGDVNGTDNWSEEKGHGRTVHRAVDDLKSGPVFGQFRTEGDWTTRDGATLLRETKHIRVYDLSACSSSLRLMDFTLELQATNGDMRFGDTKEGGLLSVRVATTMDAVRDGRIENSYGAVGEAECWGRRAHWCDYSGPVDGHWSGIAVMEHPDTFRSPTYWHVRDYGLMCTNPFGEGTFRGDPAHPGAYTLPAGERLVFAYRVAVHTGDATEARITEAYHHFINPPGVSVVG